MFLRRRRDRSKRSLSWARAERKVSDRLRVEAEALVEELRAIRERNHFAESLRKMIERDGS